MSSLIRSLTVSALFLHLSLPLLSATTESTEAPTLRFMFYNVYNLFDAEHDAGKEDWMFLPVGYPGKEEGCAKDRNPDQCNQTDWTNAKVELKISQLTKAIKAAAETSMPTCLGLAEVENGAVVSKLAAKLGYAKVIVSHSADERGIDVALLCNPHPMFMGWNPQIVEHQVSGPAISKPTRPVLEVKIPLQQNRMLHVLVNHWPSQGAPTPAREAAANVVSEVTAAALANSEHYVIAIGDFNTTDNDTPNPFNTVLVDEAHLDDAHELFMADPSVSSSIKNSLPKGTSFYPPNDQPWDRLDRIWLSKNLSDDRNLEAVTASYRIAAPNLIRKDYHYPNNHPFHPGEIVVGIPWRGNLNTLDANQAGFGDHFPVRIDLTLK